MASALFTVKQKPYKICGRIKIQSGVLIIYCQEEENIWKIGLIKFYLNLSRH